MKSKSMGNTAFQQNMLEIALVHLELYIFCFQIQEELFNFSKEANKYTFQIQEHWRLVYCYVQITEKWI